MTEIINRLNLLGFSTDRKFQNGAFQSEKYTMSDGRVGYQMEIRNAKERKVGKLKVIHHCNTSP